MPLPPGQATRKSLPLRLQEVWSEYLGPHFITPQLSDLGHVFSLIAPHSSSLYVIALTALQNCHRSYVW